MILEQYLNTGKVKLVYKDLPVVGGNSSAEAAWCAHERGNFWEFHHRALAIREQQGEQISLDGHLLWR